MSFTLPDLPYPYDALAPYMSRETLEYHHDKHHLAYVNTGNNLMKGTEFEGKPVEEVVKGSYGKNQPLFNNAGQHFNHGGPSFLLHPTVLGRHDAPPQQR